MKTQRLPSYGPGGIVPGAAQKIEVSFGGDFGPLMIALERMGEQLSRLNATMHLGAPDPPRWSLILLAVGIAAWCVLVAMGVGGGE